MPYRWHTTPKGARLEIWPYQSLPKRGFAVVIGLAAAVLALPLFALLGSVLLWGMLPFVALTLWALWAALQRSYRTGSLRETLTLESTLLTLRHAAPGQTPREWEANPYWVRPALRASGGPVEAYLTLTGGPREVELGRCLTPPERRALYAELGSRLAAATRPPNC